MFARQLNPTAMTDQSIGRHFVDKLKAMVARQQAEHRAGELEVARRLARGESLGSAEEAAIRDRVVAGTFDSNRLEAAVAAFSQLDELLDRAQQARAELVKRKEAAAKAAPELDAIKRRIPELEGIIWKVNGASALARGREDVLRQFVRQHIDIFGDIDIDGLIAGTLRVEGERA